MASSRWGRASCLACQRSHPLLGASEETFALARTLAEMSVPLLPTGAITAQAHDRQATASFFAPHAHAGQISRRFDRTACGLLGDAEKTQAATWSIDRAETPPDHLI